MAIAAIATVLIGGYATRASAADPTGPAPAPAAGTAAGAPRLTSGQTPGGAATAIAEDQYVLLINLRSDKCLDQDYFGGVKHSAVTAYPCNGQPNQQWKWTHVGYNWYTVKNARSGECLDQDTRGGVSYPAVQAFACNGAFNQLWTPANEVLTQNNAGSSVFTYNFPNGQSHNYLDQNYNGGENREVLVWPPNGSANQRWYVAG